MAARALHHLGRPERDLLARLIAAGEFHDEADFEEFAVRRALAQLRLQELWSLRERKPQTKLTTEKILREARSVRRAVARKHES